jgi:hypothetical protein
MRFPPYNRIQQLRASWLLRDGSADQGLCVVYYVDMYLAGKRAGKSGSLDDLFPEKYRKNPELLRKVPNLPQGNLIVMPAAHVPENLLPKAVSLSLARAILSLSSDAVYNPNRPLVPTESRLNRRIVLLSPKDYFQHEY